MLMMNICYPKTASSTVYHTTAYRMMSNVFCDRAS